MSNLDVALATLVGAWSYEAAADAVGWDVATLIKHLDSMTVIEQRNLAELVNHTRALDAS